MSIKHSNHFPETISMDRPLVAEWTVDHGNRQGKALAHAEGRGVGQVEQLGMQFQVLSHGQLGTERKRLGHMSDGPGLLDRILPSLSGILRFRLPAGLAVN